MNIRIFTSYELQKLRGKWLWDHLDLLNAWVTLGILSDHVYMLIISSNYTLKVDLGTVGLQVFE